MSSGPAWPPDSILPEVQFVLDWNPPEMLVGEVADVDMRTQAMRTTTIGSSRKAAFYDKHLASHLILKRVIYLDELVSVMASTVDQAIHDAVAKQPLPRDIGLLSSVMTIERQVSRSDWTKYQESGVAEAYGRHTAMYCLPIASTLAIHPSSELWDNLLVWTVDGKLGKWAIADGVLRMLPAILQDGHAVQEALKNENDGKNALLKQLALHSTTLAVWEIKRLTVGTAQVMTEIVEMGRTNSEFPWLKCTARACAHTRLDDMPESMKNYDEGVDPRSPPWRLPTNPSLPASSSQPTPLREGLRSASASGSAGGATRLSYKESSLSSLEDGEGVGEKRCHDGSDGSEYDQPPPKKSKSDLIDQRDKDYDPPPGARQEVNAQSFLQQVTTIVCSKRCF